MTRPFVSIIVPAFEEEGNIEALAIRVRASLENLPVDYELVIVDDGSGDATWEHIAHSPNCSIAKARRLLGYQPTTPLKIGLPRFIEWFHQTRDGA